MNYSQNQYYYHSPLPNYGLKSTPIISKFSRSTDIDHAGYSHKMYVVIISEAQLDICREYWNILEYVSIFG